jgi:hypothetical protein
MATFTGTIQHNDLEGGFLELKTDGGDVYRLEGAAPSPGARVRIEGEVQHGGFGIHMSGPSLKVSRVEAVDG